MLRAAPCFAAAIILASAVFLSVAPAGREPFVAIFIALRTATFLVLASIAAALFLSVVATPLFSTRLNLLTAGAVALVLIGSSIVMIASVPAVVSSSAIPIRASQSEVRILSWNVQQRSMDARVLVNLMKESDADIVVLQELYLPRLNEWFPSNKLPPDYTALGSQTVAVTVFVKKSLREYRVSSVGSPPGYPGVVVEPIRDDSQLPTIVATHLTRQTITGNVTLWNNGLNWVANHCNAQNVVAVGDFNATPQNVSGGTLGSCQFVPNGGGVQSAPTWPSTAWVQLGAQIDHVMPSNKWVMSYYRTLTVPGGTSDHRALFAVIEPADPTHR